MKSKIYNNYQTGKYKVYLKVQGADFTSHVKMKFNDQEYRGIALSLPQDYDWNAYTYRLINTIDLEQGKEYNFELYKDGEGKSLNLEEIRFEKVE